MFIHQPSMAAGEVAPDLYGRVDQALYYIGLRTALNFIIRQYGGAANRMGTRFTCEGKDSSRKMRGIPFSFNEEQTYAIQLGHQYMRFIKQDGEILEASKVITGVTQASPGVVTSASHGFSNGDDVFITGVSGMTELNGRSFRVAGVTTNTFQLNDYQNNTVSTLSYGAYSSGGTVARIYTVATPWTEDDLFELNFAQSNDVLTIVHPDYYPRDITRTAHTAWTVSLFGNTDGPFKDVNTTSTTVYSNAATGTVTLTASTSLFTASMVDSLFMIEQEPNDTTKRWEVEVGIRDGEIRRADEHYYQAPTHGVSATITGITAASPGVVTTSGAHGLANGDVVYISGVSGMLEVNGQFFKVLVKTSTTFSLQRTDGVDYSTSSFTAYTSGGTVEKAHLTGTVKPYHTEGSSKDGDPGVTWTYLHSGFGIVKITAASGTTATATVINRLPTNVVGSGGATTLWSKAAWSADEGYPSACAYHKQRMAFAATRNQPNVIWFSGVSLRAFFGKSRPILDDEAITVALDGTELNAIRHLLPLRQLISLTGASEQLISGKDNLLLATETPSTDIQGYTGASKVRPIIIGNTAIFVQDLGNAVRSLQYSLESDTFTGIELSARSPHLFRGKTVVDWAYQRHPFSVIWTAMSDGTLNGFTYMKEQEVYAWHRHSTDGFVESVCSIREGQESAVYMVVRREINGGTRRYFERFGSREFTDVRDMYFVDCGLTYDGRINNNVGITITGGTTWNTPEVLTLTATAGVFTSADVGNRITFWDGNTAYHLDITAVASDISASAVPTKELPVAYRGLTRTDWEFAKTTFRPLYHLEGKTVSVLADGRTVRGLVVSNGAVTLPTPAAVVHIGLPYVSDLETLDMASPPPGQTKAKSLNIPRVFVTVQETRALKVGTSSKRFNALSEMRFKDYSAGYDRPLPLQTSIFEVATNNDWSNQGRVCLRNDEPVACTVTCITPEVILGYG